MLELDRPQTRERHPAEAGADDQAGGSDHWRELTPHRPEEGLARLAWKQLARSGERYGKRFADPQPRPHLLAPDPALPREQALEHLSARIWQLAASGESYGLVQAAPGLVLVAGLLAQESGGAGNLRQMLSRSGQLLVVCLPLLVLLFVFMPRLGPLWPQAELGRARTGLSDQLDPGAIAQLALDPSPALRISPAQEQDLPPADQRYWRVRVLDHFDGQRWRASSPQGPAPTGAPPAPVQPGAGQQLWLVEPSPVRALPWGGSGVPLNPQITRPPPPPPTWTSPPAATPS